MARCLALLAATLLVAACAPMPSTGGELQSQRPAAGAPPVPAPQGGGLPAGQWQVTEIAGQPVPANVDVNIAFASGRATGRSGCNRYMGPVTTQKAGVRFGPMAGTMMACVGPAEEVERAYLDMLEQVRSIEVEPDGTLVMTAADGRTIRARRRSGAG